MKPKKRLDALLVERGLAETRAKAQALILAGAVWSGERKLDKAGMPVAGDVALELRGRDHPWVSRGGIKLAHALEHFSIDVAGAIALDIGASTGGFTDVLLTKGTARVYAVDVGHGQLAWKLRQDPRVTVLERVNARHLTAAEIPEPLDLVVCDASFIGLETVLPAALALAKPHAKLVALIKPQFEVGPENVGKRGVVRDPALHRAVCARIVRWLEGLGWKVEGVAESPITGPEGNVEFLIYASR
ncbi:MAG TPA: TlyA family RNA methyltransferase [Stellaceae bacterium]|nr:TlyA family RNA methyltransferase [Stellaceae bacterium]